MTVMVFGTFDILHCGHLQMFIRAKKYASRLVVVVARDINVAKVKGKKPLHNENERLFVLEQIKLVDQVVLGDRRNVYKRIEEFKPEIVALGYDQKHFVSGLKEQIKKNNWSVKIIRLPAFRTHRHKTSKIKKYLTQQI